MILIAHRGLTNGPDKALENHPEKIKNSLSQGFDCEIDLWLVGSKFYLGHDNPVYSINENFLKQKGLWIHTKNLEALECLSTSKLNYFWHQGDDYVITSHHYIWAQPGKPLNKRTICVMPEWSDPELKNIDKSCYGVCSDFISKIKETLNESSDML